MPAARYAIYYVPASESPLGRFGAGVLGYDCFEAVETARLPIPDIDPAALASLTAEPARYGFHATLKAPFRLPDGAEGELASAVASFARRHRTALLGRLEVACIGSFVVLRPIEQSPQIEALAAATVEAFDTFRAPLSESERERRLAAGLSARQVALMERWGNPYVFEEFRFHMTLAGPVPADKRTAVKNSLARAFEPLAGDPIEIEAIALMRQDNVEDDPNARFRVASHARFKRDRATP